MMLLIATMLNMKVRDIEAKILPVKEYLYKVIPHLANMINDHKTQGEWKI